ncbi:hypothetical protein GQR58_005221 [Nymphon striatum]|nr:hypothetical protein GQR58_005221 [Nymphon striatum]
MPSYIRTSQSDFRFQEDNKDVILLVGANAKLADCYVNALENEFPNSDVIYCKDIQHIEQLRLSTIKSVNLVIVDHSLNDKNIFQVDSLKSLFSSKPVTLAYDNSEVCSNYVRKYGERFDSHLPMDVKLDVWLSIIRLILSGGNYICPELLKEKYQKLETPCKIDTEQTRNVAAHNIVDIANEGIQSSKMIHVFASLQKEKQMLSINLIYRCAGSCDALLQIEAAKTHQQTILEEKVSISPQQQFSRFNADDGIGERIWLHLSDEFNCQYTAKIKLNRSAPLLTDLKQSPLAEIQSDAIKYLLPSRYCHLEKFEGQIPNQFNGLSGGSLVAAMASWIKTEFTYLAGASDALTTAHDTMASKQGVCRDYSHVLIAMLRVSGIPARMVSAYAPNVSPPDFHALVEVYLDGSWHLVDPTGMTNADEVAIIGVGRDAADISFLTSFGFLELVKQTVSVKLLDESKP